MGKKQIDFGRKEGNECSSQVDGKVVLIMHTEWWKFIKLVEFVFGFSE